VLLAQFDDTFSDDPLASGDWVFNGVATWVPTPGEALECVDPNVFDTLDPCSVYNEDDVAALGETLEEFGGYILVTYPGNTVAGNAFRAEPDTYDNFKMEVVVELRDGSIGRPADGMVIVVVGSNGPPMDTGTGGGGMGAPCVGDPDNAPMMAWEFDNWSCNTGDNNDQNHLAFSYSPNGFPCTDAIQPQVFVPLPEATVDLHNQEPPKATPNRYRMTVYAQNCGGVLTVACDLEAIDRGINLGRIYTHVVQNFVPFEGFLGVTASTGNAWQNHILHSASLEELPPDFCLQPAANAVRSITSTRNLEDNCGDFLPGEFLSVALTLQQVRAQSDCCSPPASITVTDTLPTGWTASNISDSGSFNAGTGVVTWTLAGGAITNGRQLTYRANAPNPADFLVNWGAGRVVENVAGSIGTIVTGQSRAKQDRPFDDCGAITCWNLLGAYMQGGGAAPGVDAMRLDYLTDGSIPQEDFTFEPGAEINTDFFGAAASTGLFADAPMRNPGGVPTVFAWNESDGDGFVDYNVQVFPPAPDNTMAYAQIYVNAESPMSVNAALSSDDAVRVLLNKEEVHINNVARDALGTANTACVPQDMFPVELVGGENSLVVEVFEGGGDWDFSFRFQDELGNPITEGLSVSKFPIPGCRVPPARFLRTVDTGTTVIIGRDPRPSWLATGEAYDVSIAISDRRPAAGDCAAAGTTTVVETVPAGWIPSAPSRNGQVNGQTITWVIAGGDLSGTLTYSVTSGGNCEDVRFGGTVSEQASNFQFRVGGDSIVSFAPAPFGRGDSTVFLSDNFNNTVVEAGCPAGWTCNGGGIGFSPFRPGVTQAAGHTGRLRLANETTTIGSTVIYNNPINLEDQSFTAEFDVFFEDTTPADLLADGMTFMVLDADDPLTSVNSLGGAGGGTGYAGLNGFAVEFDLWQNDITEPSGYNIPALAFTHVGLIKGGAVTPHVQTHIDLDPDMRPLALGGTGWPEWVDFTGTGGIPIHVEIDYNNGNIEVYVTAPATAGGAEPAFPRTKVIDTIITFPAAGVPGECVDPVLRNALLGFSAGTGGAWAIHEVDNVVVTAHERSEGPGPGPLFHRGDTTGEGTLNITDGVNIFNWLFLGGQTPGCLEAANPNDGAAINITSGVYLLNFLFLGGPTPPPPGPPTTGGGTPCGPDPPNSPSNLGCVTYNGC
jgi:hypothetical protein